MLNFVSLPVGISFASVDTAKINNLSCDEGMFYDGYECVHTPAGIAQQQILKCLYPVVKECCSLGYYSPLNSAVYYACPRGQYSLGGSSSCEVVPTGIYFD